MEGWWEERVNVQPGWVPSIQAARQLWTRGGGPVRAKITKSTTLMLGRIKHYEVRPMCTYEKKLWRKPSTGGPPLKGKTVHWGGEVETVHAENHYGNQDQGPTPPLSDQCSSSIAWGANERLATTITQNATLRTHQDNFRRCGKYALKRRRSDDKEEATVRTRVQLTAPLRGQDPELEKRGGTTLGRNEKSPQDLQGDARVQTGWPSPLPGT